MLRDFPVLFDVRDVELTGLNMYLKDLFTGYKGAKERALAKKGLTPPRPTRVNTSDAFEDASAGARARAPSELVEDPEEDVRGKVRDTVFVDKQFKVVDSQGRRRMNIYLSATLHLSLNY